MPYSNEFLFWQQRNFKYDYRSGQSVGQNATTLLYYVLPRLLDEALAEKDLDAAKKIIRELEHSSEGNQFIIFAKYRFSDFSKNKNSILFLFQNKLINEKNYGVIFILIINTLSMEELDFLLLQDRDNCWLSIADLKQTADKVKRERQLVLAPPPPSGNAEYIIKYEAPYTDLIIRALNDEIQYRETVEKITAELNDMNSRYNQFREFIINKLKQNPVEAKKFIDRLIANHQINEKNRARVLVIIIMTTNPDTAIWLLNQLEHLLRIEELIFIINNVKNLIHARAQQKQCKPEELEKLYSEKIIAILIAILKKDILDEKQAHNIKEALPSQELTAITITGELRYFLHNAHHLEKLTSLTLQDCKLVPVSKPIIKKTRLEELFLINIDKNFFAQFFAEANRFLDGEHLTYLHVEFQNPQSITKDDLAPLVRLFPKLITIKFLNLQFNSIDDLYACVCILGNNLKFLNKVDLAKQATVTEILPRATIADVTAVLEKSRFELALPPVLGQQLAFPIRKLLHFHATQNIYRQHLALPIPVQDAADETQSYVRDIGDDILSLIPAEHQACIRIYRRKSENATEDKDNKDMQRYEYVITTQGQNLEIANIVLGGLIAILNKYSLNYFKFNESKAILSHKHPLTVQDNIYTKTIFRWMADKKDNPAQASQNEVKKEPYKDFTEQLRDRISKAIQQDATAKAQMAQAFHNERTRLSGRYGRFFAYEFDRALTLAELKVAEHAIGNMITIKNEMKEIESYRKKAIDYIQRLPIIHVKTAVSDLKQQRSKAKVFRNVQYYETLPLPKSLPHDVLAAGNINNIINAVLDIENDQKFDFKQDNQDGNEKHVEMQKLVFVAKFSTTSGLLLEGEIIPFIENQTINDLFQTLMMLIKEFLAEIKHHHFAVAIRHDLFTVEGFQLFFANKNRFLEWVTYKCEHPLAGDYDPKRFFTVPPEPTPALNPAPAGAAAAAAGAGAGRGPRYAPQLT